MFSAEMLNLLGQGILETLYMTVISTLLGYVFGLPLGVLLCVTSKDGVRPIGPIYGVLGFSINLARSVPFLILLVAVLPLTRAIVGTTIGSTATIVPLVIGSAPFIARIVESALREVDAGAIEAARAMGANTFQVIMKVLLPESRPALLTGAAITATTILGYSAMAGFVGGGGLGTIAIQYGYYRYQKDVMLVTVCLLIVIVQLIQEVGIRVSKRTDKRIKNS